MVSFFIMLMGLLGREDWKERVWKGSIRMVRIINRCSGWGITERVIGGFEAVSETYWSVFFLLGA